MTHEHSRTGPSGRSPPPGEREARPDCLAGKGSMFRHAEARPSRSLFAPIVLALTMTGCGGEGGVWKAASTSIRSRSLNWRREPQELGTVLAERGHCGLPAGSSAFGRKATRPRRTSTSPVLEAGDGIRARELRGPTPAATTGFTPCRDGCPVDATPPGSLRPLPRRRRPLPCEPAR